MISRFRRVFGSVVVVGVSLLLLVVSCVVISERRASAQPLPPDRDYLYSDDKAKKQAKTRTNDKAGQEVKELDDKHKQLVTLEKTGKLPFDISARSLTYSSTGDQVIADGGVIIVYSQTLLEAVRGVVNLQTNEATVTGDVRLTDQTGDITGDSAKINLTDGTGVIENGDVHLSAGEFQLHGKEVHKLGEETFELNDSTLSTCQCSEDRNCPPWRIVANKARIVRNGYGQAWGATFDVMNVPVFYTPYLVFPAKTSRQTGLLSPTFGYSGRYGVELRMPFFWAINGSTDATITPIVETNVRYGVDTEFREIFSQQSKLKANLIYLNESPRGDAALGTNSNGLFDATRDTNRFGGYWSQNWKNKPDDFIPLQFIAKGRYVSDNLLLREYDASDIGPYNSSYLVSKAVLRSPLTSEINIDVSSEYTHSLVSDNDFIFQRAPEINVSALKTFNAFGDNPFGLKLVSDTELSFVEFLRNRSYTGSRSEVLQSLKIPFYLKNYLDGSIEGRVRASEYVLDENKDIKSGSPDDSSFTLLKSNSDRLVPGVIATLGSGVERVFQLDEGNILRTIGELGPMGRESALTRVKHSIEPFARFKYTPDVNQDDNPLFDSLDHLSEKRVVTYGVTQRLYGRYEPRGDYATGVEELAPTADDLGSFRSGDPLSGLQDFGSPQTGDAGFQRLRSGSLRELADFQVSQSYDLLKADQDLPSGQSEFSDVNLSALVFPNDYVILRADTDYNTTTSQFDDYDLGAQLSDKRSDSIRTRVRFNDGQFRQLESNLELALTESVRFGYYSRYDDLTGKFLEQQVGMRYISKCKCWMFDVDYGDRINPDEQRVMVNVTLAGLGDLKQKFGTSNKR